MLTDVDLPAKFDRSAANAEQFCKRDSLTRARIFPPKNAGAGFRL